ncbi:hypothetical protein H6A18_00345 [Collinsella tanakaei]|uniref:hypothetical protein n=1 Tax=Collinsella tanakaei TaxID=626935 RepID=UPI001957D1DB|nr:hypothetical protein [Collinsella tanakaei]MBM6754992.1 hypothetical protein [Collinsella tanakaei]MBM6867751.1 hypothetical protein [Collinsella tanakaei]
MSDEFFDDEQELMEKAAPAATPKKKAAEAQPSAPAPQDAPRASDAGRREPPPFWMVLAIAVIALVLGVVIGYLIGTSTAYSALQVVQSDEALEAYGDSSSTTDSSEMLPEGHPQLDIKEDGTATVVEGDEADAS